MPKVLRQHIDLTFTGTIQEKKKRVILPKLCDLPLQVNILIHTIFTCHEYEKIIVFTMLIYIYAYTGNNFGF